MKEILIKSEIIRRLPLTESAVLRLNAKSYGRLLSAAMADMLSIEAVVRNIL